ncbi:MAG: YbjN domain-containing protein [Gaiellaceae bacterium]
MIQTTFEITFSDDNFAGVTVETNADGELKLQAELVGFAHLVATVISSLGRERARALVQSLADGGFADDEFRFDGSSGGMVWIGASFLDARRGPRLFFELKPRDLRRIGKDPDVLAARSVLEVLRALAGKRSGDAETAARLRATAALIAGAAESGHVRDNTAFDVSLAAADLSWGAVEHPPGVPPWASSDDLRCPACGSRELESRVWPSSRAALRCCASCGAGLWFRAGRRPRSVPDATWKGSERLRDDLKALSKSGSKGTVSSGEPIAGSLLADLRTLFRENGWPFSDVRGAPVLFSELSGILGRWKFYAQVVEEQDLILLYSVCPFRVPEERRSEVSEFLTRANYGLAAGNFELDFADGEVRYKTALQRHVDGLDAATLKRAVRANGIAMETYLPGVGAVITGTAPVPALERHGGVA